MDHPSEEASHSYGAILRLPGALGFTLAGIPARMHLQGAALAITLLIVAQTGSYALAGGLVAAFTIARGISGPWLSRMVDRRGQFAVMSVATITQAVLTVLLAFGTVWGWNFWVLGALAAAAGLSSGAPPAYIRARWVGVITHRRQLDTAFAWESMVESFGVAITPIILVAVAGASNPLVGVLFLAAISIVGGCALYLQRATEPKVTRHGDQARVQIPRDVVIRVFVLTIYYFCASVAMGVWNIIAVEQGEHSDVPGLTGWVLSSFAVGTMIGAFIYGAIRWRIRPEQRLVVIMPLFFLSTLVTPFLEGSSLLIGASFLVGLPFIAILTSTNLAVQDVSPKGRLTEMLAWLAASVGVGVSTGNLLGGVVIDTWGFVACSMLLLGAGTLGLVTLAVQLARSRSAGIGDATDGEEAEPEIASAGERDAVRETGRPE